MRRALPLIICWACVATNASAQYEKSQFRETVILTELQDHSDTLMIWVDEGVKGRIRGRVTLLPWVVTQGLIRYDLVHAYRSTVYRSPHESYRTWHELGRGDRYYMPMKDTSFVFVRIDLRSRDSERLSFMLRPDDSLLVQLRNGRVYAAVPGRDLGEPAAGLDERLGRAQPQLRYWTRGRYLYTRAQLRERWPRLQIPGIPDQVNEFMVHVPNKGDDFGFREIEAVRIRIHGQWVTLTRRPVDRSQSALAR